MGAAAPTACSLPPPLTNSRRQRRSSALVNSSCDFPEANATTAGSLMEPRIRGKTRACAMLENRLAVEIGEEVAEQGFEP